MFKMASFLAVLISLTLASQCDARVRDQSCVADRTYQYGDYSFQDPDNFLNYQSYEGYDDYQDFSSYDYNGYQYAAQGDEAPQDQCCGRYKGCWCLWCHWEPYTYNCYSYIDEPYNYRKQCCRYVPQYCEVQRCRWVPQYYTDQVCYYMPEYYYTDDWATRRRIICQQQCQWVPKYYCKRMYDDCCPRRCDRRRR